MSCYVDPAQNAFGRMIMCHLWADSDAELLHMAETIGVDRKWIQGHPTLSFGKHKSASWVHFDISKSKRKLAVQNGAIETDRYSPSEFVKKQKLIAAVMISDWETANACIEWIHMINNLRQRNKDTEHD